MNKNQMIRDIIKEIKMRNKIVNIQDYGLKLRYSGLNFGAIELDLGMLVDGLPIPWV